MIISEPPLWICHRGSSKHEPEVGPCLLHARAYFIHCIANIGAFDLRAGQQQVGSDGLQVIGQETNQHIHLEVRIFVDLSKTERLVLIPDSYGLHVTTQAYHAECLEQAEHVAGDGPVVRNRTRVHLVNHL